MNDIDERRNELYGGQQPKKRNIIISAEEARARAINSGKIKAEEELKPVFDEIMKASGDGRFKVEYGKKLSGFAIMRLGELGYNLSAVDASNAELGYIINWEVKI